jgi:hypothetical protein
MIVTAQKQFLNTLLAILLIGGVLTTQAQCDENLPDNAGLRLPFAEPDSSSIKIEEAMHYRHPRDYSNQASIEFYRQFSEDCGEDEECIKHFADYDRVLIPHKSIDYVNVTGGTFTVYAGVVGKVHKIVKFQSQPYFTSVIVKAKVKGKQIYIKYTHLDPDSVRLEESQVVLDDTPIGQVYADKGVIWNLDGIDVKGYCRPNEMPHPFFGHQDNRCYPAHLDFQVGELIGDIFEARDPYDICRALKESNLNSCKGYNYPGNRFNTPAKPLGAHHLWELDKNEKYIKAAVSLPVDNASYCVAGNSHPLSMKTGVQIH